MANDYASAVRNGVLGAARLHNQFDNMTRMHAHGGNVDVFGTVLSLKLPLLLRPLQGLLGAYIPDPIPGVIITTQRTLNIQRFTAAHELGHFYFKHKPSLDDEKILRRMAMPIPSSASDGELQEIEADAFASAFLMPRWLIEWHCQRQGWLKSSLRNPHNLYQLSLRLGCSYEAMCWTLQRYNFISVADVHILRETQPRELKAQLLDGYNPENYYGDVWLLTEHDASTYISGSRNDHFILHLNEHSSGGYLWNIDQLQASGFVIIKNSVVLSDEESVGGPVIRRITANLEEATLGHLSIDEQRPWQPNNPINNISIEYDFTGPEEEGISRAERRLIFEAA